MTHPQIIISASKEAISTVIANFPISSSCSLFLLNSNEKVVKAASSALYFWDHHRPIQIVAKPRKSLDNGLVYLSLANPVLKPEVCRNPQLN